MHCLIWRCYFYANRCIANANNGKARCKSKDRHLISLRGFYGFYVVAIAWRYLCQGCIRFCELMASRRAEKGLVDGVSAFRDTYLKIER